MDKNYTPLILTNLLKKGGRKLPNSLMRFHGQPIEMRDHFGRVHRGIMDGFDPRRRGVFIRDRFRRRRFIPFFLIVPVSILASEDDAFSKK